MQENMKEYLTEKEAREKRLEVYTEKIQEKVLSRSSETIRQLVEERHRQKMTQQEKGINCNAQMTTELIQRYCVLDKDSLKLLRETSEKGLLLSEYPPGTPPSRYTFPRRNRLISSWSDKLIIIQAGKGSGALITAEYSRKYGRKVEMRESG